MERFFSRFMRRLLVRLMFGGLAAAALSVPAHAAACTVTVGYRVMQIGGRPVAVWYPTAARASTEPYSVRFSGEVARDAAPSRACGMPAPLVVFSHGNLGCGLQSVAFTEELARNGYVVAAPDHADAALCHTLPPSRDARPFGRPSTPAPSASASPPNFFDPDSWDESCWRDRRRDIEAVIGALLADPDFRSVIDAKNIGAAGHSLGGYTVVGLAGGWPGWTDSRIRAVLAMSPYVMPFQAHHTLANVRVPIMYQGGDLDGGITPFLKGPRGAYASSNAPAYYAELQDAAHLAWANCGAERTTEACLANVPNARLIADYGIAFFNRYLKGRDEPLLERRAPLLAEYIFKLQ